MSNDVKNKSLKIMNIALTIIHNNTHKMEDIDDKNMQTYNNDSVKSISVKQIDPLCTTDNDLSLHLSELAYYLRKNNDAYCKKIIKLIVKDINIHTPHHMSYSTFDKLYKLSTFNK